VLTDLVAEMLDIAARRARTQRITDIETQVCSARERIRANAIVNVSEFEKDGSIRVPGAARCIVGTKVGASVRFA